VIEVPNAIPSIQEIAPFVQGGANVSFNGNAQNTVEAGVTGAFAKVARVRMREGRFISELDKFELFCVLGSTVAGQLSGPQGTVRLGSNLRIGQYIFTVIGILEPTLQSPMMPLDSNETLFISIPNARRILPSSQITTALARLAPNAGAETAAAQAVAYFRPKLHDSQLQVQSAEQLIAGMASQMQLFELLLGAIGAISLVLGGVGVMNIMLVSVSERHREIGLRLAIGARRRDIQILFLFEAVILAVVGGGIGIVLGIGASYGFALTSAWTFVLSPTAAPLGAGVSVLVCIFFGFYPAFMASRLNPITALRAE
jgi:putative ABC transport system permease protein